MPTYDQSSISKLEKVLAQIPLAHAMQVRIVQYEAGCLRLTAPGKPNSNHFGIAFGGAIQCLGTLAGWGLLWLELGDPALRIVIRHTETHFRQPLSGELDAVVNRPETTRWDGFLKRLERRGQARLDLTAQIGDAQNTEGARFHGRYAIARNPAG